MRKTFKYRLDPTKKQIRIVSSQLEECRWLYPHFLGERKPAGEERQASIGLDGQHIEWPALKAERATRKAVHSPITQNVAVRVDRAMQAFFRRGKDGEEPGLQGQRPLRQHHLSPGAFRWRITGMSPKSARARSSTLGCWKAPPRRRRFAGPAPANGIARSPVKGSPRRCPRWSALTWV